jgi:general secretion pathway protein G
MNRYKAVTLLELLVVVLILGLLSTIAVGVFTSQVERARVSAARSTISSIELAVSRYEIDLGAFPPSGSNDGLTLATGCGYLEWALLHSIGGSSQAPSDPRWQGPYMNVKKELLGNMSGVSLEEINGPVPSPGQVQILDPWRSPYRYIRYGPAPDDYGSRGGTRLPGGHPFAATETFYNPSTVQIVSYGMDNVTLADPSIGRGTDDITNFGQ